MTGTLEFPTSSPPPYTMEELGAALNTAFTALAANFVSGTAPTSGALGLSSLAGLLWLDSSVSGVPVLKVRDPTDSSWAQLIMSALQLGQYGYPSLLGEPLNVRTLMERGVDAINVFDFIPADYIAGIKAGTDTHDLTTYLNNAHTAAAAPQSGYGGAVWYPAGTYNAQDVVYYDEQWILGSGRRSHCQPITPGGNFFIPYDWKNNVTSGAQLGAYFTGFNFTKPSTYTGGFGIVVFSDRTRIILNDFNGPGIWLTSTTSGGTAIDDVGGHHIVENRFSNCVSGGIWSPTPSPDNMIVLNTFNQCGYTLSGTGEQRASVYMKKGAGIHFVCNKIFSDYGLQLRLDSARNGIIALNNLDWHAGQTLSGSAQNYAVLIDADDSENGGAFFVANACRMRMADPTKTYTFFHVENNGDSDIIHVANRYWIDAASGAVAFNAASIETTLDARGISVGNYYSNMTQAQQGNLEATFGLTAPLVRASGPFWLSAQTDTVLSYSANNNVGRPGLTRTTAIDNLLYAIGPTLLAKADIFWVLAAASSGFGYVNLADPGVWTSQTVSGVSFVTDRGVSGNAAVSGYVYLGMTPNQLTKYDLGNASMLGWSGTDLAVTNSPLIGLIAGTRSTVNPRNASNQLSTRSQSQTTVNTSGVSNSIGSFGWSRPSTTQYYAFARGALLATISDNTTGLGTNDFTLLRDGANFSNRTLQALWLGSYITLAEYQTLDTAMTAYLTAIGAPHA